MADEINSVSGGGGGFTLNLFTNTLVRFDVPTTSFDVYIADTYIVTAQRPDGIFDLTLDSIKNYDTSSPATVSFLFPSTAADPGGAYTASFTVSWSSPAPPPDLSNYVTKTQLNTLIDQWWETEVKPELEAINTTLELILAQHTTVATNSTAVAAEIATIDTAIQRLRDLADHPSGPGIRTVTPYGYLGNAILYLLYIKQAQILEDGEAGANAQAESLGKFNDLLDEMFANFDPNRGGFGE